MIFLLKLQKNGFKCSIDDFGCGYSSYRILKSLPMDEIKLDKFFLEKSKDEKRDGYIFESIIELAKNLGMKVTQEGIETKEEFEEIVNKLGNKILLVQKDLSDVAWLEEYAGYLDCVMTFFIDDLRVSTTIKNDQGKYLTGTKLNNDKIYNIVYKTKKTYYGKNIINGQSYITIYCPFENHDDQNVMIFMGISINSSLIVVEYLLSC